MSTQLLTHENQTLQLNIFIKTKKSVNCLSCSLGAQIKTFKPKNKVQQFCDTVPLSKLFYASPVLCLAGRVVSKYPCPSFRRSFYRYTVYSIQYTVYSKHIARPSRNPVATEVATIVGHMSAKSAKFFI